MSSVVLSRIAREKYFNTVSENKFTINGNKHHHTYIGNVNLISAKEKMCCDPHSNVIKPSVVSTFALHSKMLRPHCPQDPDAVDTSMCGSNHSYNVVTSSERVRKLRSDMSLTELGCVIPPETTTAPETIVITPVVA